jgi:hypothetical protein
MLFHFLLLPEITGSRISEKNVSIMYFQLIFTLQFRSHFQIDLRNGHLLFLVHTYIIHVGCMKADAHKKPIAYPIEAYPIRLNLCSVLKI